MDLGLKGRRVLVTGGSQGIGLAVARGFLDEGAKVTIVARDEERLAQAVAELSRRGADVTAHIDGPRAPRRRAGARGRVSATPTCWSTMRARSRPAISLRSTRRAGVTRWDLKVFGYVNLMRAMYAHMRGRGPKVIVNVLGLGGERPQWRYVCGNAANVALAGRHQVARRPQHRRRHPGGRRQSGRRRDRADGVDPARARRKGIRRRRALARIFRRQAAAACRQPAGGRQRDPVSRLRQGELGVRRGGAGRRRLFASAGLVLRAGAPDACRETEVRTPSRRLLLRSLG